MIRCAYAKGEGVWTFDSHAGFLKLVQNGRDRSRIAIDYIELPACDRGSDSEGTGFDAVRNDGMLSAAEPLNPLNANRAAALSFNARAHFVEELREVHDLRFSRRVVEYSHAIGK